MSCIWGHTDCINQDKCFLCVSEDYHYKTKNIKRYTMKKKADKVTKRMGAKFEYDNHKQNEHVLNGTTARMTPNSGAGKIKGDEEINGLIKITEELKTSERVNSRGEKQFSIKKEWLEKLKRESIEANKEFFYLKFAFGDHEPSESWYVILDCNNVMSMINTIVHDRKEAKLADAKIDVYKKRADLKDAENIKLSAKIEALKAELKVLKMQQENKNE